MAQHKFRRVGWIGLGCLVGTLMLGANDAAALPIFTCGDPSACNGLTYAVTFDGQFDAQQRYSLWIQTGDTYTGEATDAIGAVALSGLLSTFTGLDPALLQAPSGVVSWSFTTNELNANGCGGGGTNSLCAQWDGTGYGVPVLPATIYQWQFGFNAVGPYDTTAHIKYQFVETTGKKAGQKIGDLGSWDIPVQQVPEDGSTLGFVGLAMLALGYFRARYV